MEHVLQTWDSVYRRWIQECIRNVATVSFLALILQRIDVPGSVHHSTNHWEITNKMRPCIRIYYSNVSYCSMCFERHIAHHQELINCICSLWFYIRLWVPADRPATIDVCKTRGCKYSFWAPDDDRCVARNTLSNKKRWNNKFLYMVASCWLFLNDSKS